LSEVEVLEDLLDRVAVVDVEGNAAMTLRLRKDCDDGDDCDEIGGRGLEDLVDRFVVAVGPGGVVGEVCVGNGGGRSREPRSYRRCARESLKHLANSLENSKTFGMETH
jgi:hypothetical protein